MDTDKNRLMLLPAKIPTFLYALACLLVLVWPYSAKADVFQVIGLKDGDTVQLLSADKKQVVVRVNAVDSPEKNQPQGQAAKKFLSSLIFKQAVEIEPVTKDRYGRTVATIWLGDKDIGLEMVKAGYAWVYEKYADRRVYPEYYAAEAEARKNRLGLWSAPGPDTTLAVAASDHAAIDTSFKG